MSAPTFTPLQKAAAWFVHLYTASGIIVALFALEAIYLRDYGTAYIWFAVAVWIDGSDGPMARRFRVKEVLPSINGGLLDNIVDYITWSFLPIVLLWRSGWLPEPVDLWCIIALLASLYAFVHNSAKITTEAMFRGFPSYWNFFVVSVDLVLRHYGPWAVAIATLALSVLSVLPIYFLYPNRLKGKEWWFHFVTGLSWFCVFVATVVLYPDMPRWMVWASFSYPIIYFVHSLMKNKGMHQK